MSNRGGKMLTYEDKIVENHKNMLSGRFKIVEKKQWICFRERTGYLTYFLSTRAMWSA